MQAIMGGAAGAPRSKLDTFAHAEPDLAGDTEDASRDGPSGTESVRTDRVDRTALGREPNQLERVKERLEWLEDISIGRQKILQNPEYSDP